MRTIANELLKTTQKEWFELTEGLFLSVFGGTTAVFIFQTICSFLGK